MARVNGGRTSGGARFCPECGKPNQADARFCASCGSPLGGSVPAGANGPSPSVYAEPSRGQVPYAIVAVALIAVIGALVWAILGRAPQKADTQGEVPATSVASAAKGESEAKGESAAKGESEAKKEPATEEESVEAEAPTFVVEFLGSGADSGSMKPVEAKKGETVVLPKCKFKRDGYKFESWTDGSGNEYEPGDSLEMSRDVTLSAKWVAAEKKNAESKADANASANIQVTTNVPETKTQPSQPQIAAPPVASDDVAPQSTPASTFPRKWSGTYIGTSSYAEGDGHISRAVAFHFTTVTETGYLEGICYVGTDDTGPGETYGTCYISGNVDWNTGAISFHGTGWIDQGGLGDLREYSGMVDFSSASMGGSAWDIGTGLYETPWNARAVDQIYIWQNGSQTVV